MTARISAVLAGALLLLGVGPSTAGDPAPTIIRAVTMAGESRLAYYSVVERRYIFIPVTLAASAARADADEAPAN